MSVMQCLLSLKVFRVHTYSLITHTHTHTHTLALNEPSPLLNRPISIKGEEFKIRLTASTSSSSLGVTELNKGQRSLVGSIGKARSLDYPGDDDVGTPCVQGVCVQSDI